MVTSDKALGVGRIGGMRDIVCVLPERFDSSKTREMAEEIAETNTALKAEERAYLLIGPGRWGSSDPNLGIPVIWSDISEAKVIVECGIPGFQVEPSQGTHFFQNITSLGVGYISADVAGGLYGDVDFGRIRGLEKVRDGKYVTVFRAKSEIVAYIDRDTNKAVVGIPSSKDAMQAL